MQKIFRLSLLCLQAAIKHLLASHGRHLKKHFKNSSAIHSLFKIGVLNYHLANITEFPYKIAASSVYQTKIMPT